MQAGDSLEVTNIASKYGIALFDGGSRDHEITERQHVAFRRFLPLDLAHQPTSLFGNRMDWNQAHQFLDVQATALTGLRSLGAEDPVDQFGDRHRRER